MIYLYIYIYIYIPLWGQYTGYKIWTKLRLYYPYPKWYIFPQGGLYRRILPCWQGNIYIALEGNILYIALRSPFWLPDMVEYILYILDFIRPYTTIWPLNLGFFVLGLRPRTKKSSVSGPYRCIWPSKTQYIHYI